MKRSPWMHCEACGYLGPRFERLGPPKTGEVVTMIALLFFVCVVGLAVALHMLFNGSRQLSCPRCGATDSLWPAAEQAGLPLDPAFVAASRANDAALRGQRRTGLFVVGVVALVGALFVVAVSGWLQRAG